MALHIKKRQNLLEENSPRGIFWVSWSPTRFLTPIILAARKVSCPEIGNREISTSWLDLYFQLPTFLYLVKCMKILLKHNSKSGRQIFVFNILGN